MKKEVFLKVVQDIIESDIYVDALYKLNFDLIESPLLTIRDTLFDELLKTWIDQDGIDVVYWWLYEDKVEKIITYQDGTKEELLTSEDLFNYLEKNHALPF
jgi:hypothetical protein